jgi:hypothetical protein
MKIPTTHRTPDITISDDRHGSVLLVRAFLTKLTYLGQASSVKPKAGTEPEQRRQ